MEAFERIYRKYLKAVFRYARYCVGRRDIAEEITAEAFLALYRNFDSMDEERLPAWLFSVARNRATDYWRRSKLERGYAESIASDCEAHPASLPEDNVLDNPALKPVHRVCLILRYVQGMERAEIAQLTGLTETQVKGYLQYAKEILRRERTRQCAE